MDLDDACYQPFHYSKTRHYVALKNIGLLLISLYNNNSNNNVINMNVKFNAKIIEPS